MCVVFLKCSLNYSQRRMDGLDSSHNENNSPSNSGTSSIKNSGVKKKRNRKNKKFDNTRTGLSQLTPPLNSVKNERHGRVDQRNRQKKSYDSTKVSSTISPRDNLEVRNPTSLVLPGAVHYFGTDSNSDASSPSISNSSLKGESMIMPTLTEEHSRPVKKKKSSCKTVTPKPKPFYRRYNEINTVWQRPEEETEVENSVPTENEAHENFENIDFHFDIKSIQKPTSGTFIRKKSLCKYINLSSLEPNIPVVHTSNFQKKPSNSIDVVSQNMKKITLNETTECSSSKENQRKTNNKNGSNNKSLKLSSTLKEQNMTCNVDQKLNKKSKNRRKSNTTKKQKVPISYSDYIDEVEVEEGLRDGSLVKGCIRINQKNSREAYVTNNVKGEVDFLIKSVLDRNRALDGDEVVLRVKPQRERQEDRKEAVVVYISRLVHSRTSIGKLLPLPNNENLAIFLPRDTRFPTLLIPTISWPQGFKSEPEKYEKNLYMAKMTEWTEDGAKGLIVENIGASGDLKNESLAILKTYGLDHEPFGNDALKDLPRFDELQESWLEGREDLRKECIFTIDPLTARDLDDAMSCKRLPDGNFEIGVHISDVTFFLREGTELDHQVSWRGTTIYMVDRVYHMLPVELCMACSLLPSKDKLTYSVFWKMSPDAQILSTRFSRSVINSCAQLAYEHAQAIIDNPENFDASSLPKIANGYTVEDIKDVVLNLYNLSKILKRDRYRNGSLKIDQIKIYMNLDPETGLPRSYRPEVMKEANFLIEEFMLLANISVANKIYESFPEIAFLRLHEPPKESMMIDLQNGLESIGIHIDISSAKTIQKCLSSYSTNDQTGKIRAAVLNYFFAKPMMRARYFCPAVQPSDTSFGHFALNVPLYTHFTSPIRRYADVMVHRLLGASLELAPAPSWESDFVSEVAERCNTLKYNAKKAQQDSTKLYLTVFISKYGPLVADAAVVDVKVRSFDVIVLECGEIVRIYLQDIADAFCEVEEIFIRDLDQTPGLKEQKKRYWKIIVNYPPTKHEEQLRMTIEWFTEVKIELRMCSKQHKLRARLLRPETY